MNKRGPGVHPSKFSKKIDWKWLIRVILEHICEIFYFYNFIFYFYFFGIRSNSVFSGAVGSYGVCVPVCVIAHVRASDIAQRIANRHLLHLLYSEV